MIAGAAIALPLISALPFAADRQAIAGENMKVQGESLVLAATQPGNLCFDQVVEAGLVLRSTFAADQPGSIIYDEGADYLVDYSRGTVARTPDSRIPDYATHSLYGQDDFDHTKFADCSNHRWFVWADYETTNGLPWAEPRDESELLKTVRAKLEAGGPFRIASYGDSITAGGEASEARFTFQHRFAQCLRSRFPEAVVEAEDASISGYASRQGVDWFDDYLGKVQETDLVLVGFGMNDHNIGNAEPETFKENLVTIVEMIRDRKGAEVILFSAFPPNDKWHYGTQRMEQYARATEQAATEAQCAYVDVYSTWEMVLRRKDQSSLLGNNINHPNDFGHWLYAQAFEAMGF